MTDEQPKRKRGQRGPGKVKKDCMPTVTIRVTQDVLDFFKQYEEPTVAMRKVLATWAEGRLIVRDADLI